MFRHLFFWLMFTVFLFPERRVKPLNVTPIYCKTSRTLQCTVCDKYKKTLVQSNNLTNEDLHLKAVTLSAGSIQYKGKSLTQAFKYKCMTSEMSFWRYPLHIFCFFQFDSVCQCTHRVPHKITACLCAWESPTATSTLLVPSLMILLPSCSWRFVHHKHINLPQKMFSTL